MDAKKEIELTAKLGLVPGLKIKLINEPLDYKGYLTYLVKDICFVNKLNSPVDVIHLFAKSKKELIIELPVFTNYLNTNGSLIIYWPSVYSNTFTDLTESFILNLALGQRLKQVVFFELDNKWCASKFIII